MSTTLPDDRVSEYSPVVPTTEFPAGFPVFDNADLAVYVDGEERTDFTVSATYVNGIANDAKAVFSVGITGHVQVVGDRAPHRTNRFNDGAPVPTRDFNLALDTLEAEHQEAARNVQRSHKAPYGEEGGVFTAEDVGHAQEYAAAAKEYRDDAATIAAGIEANSQPAFTLRSRAYAITAFHPALAALWIKVMGYAAAGDGGEATYRKVDSEPSHAGKLSITLEDGVSVVWYEIAETTIRPQMLGAVADSVADQTAIMQDWLDTLAATGADGYVSKGVYRLDGELSSSADDIHVECHRNARFDASGAPNGGYSLTFSGSIGAYANITVGNAQLGATRIRTTSVFAQSLVIGDVIKIKSANNYDASNTDSLYGELNIVAGLVDAATGFVDVELPLSATYDNAPQVAKLTPIRNVYWQGGRFEGAIAEENNQKAVRIKLARDFLLSDVVGERMDDRVFWIEDSLNGEIARPGGYNARPTSTGYGVSVIDACQDIVVHHGQFENVRHSFSTNNQTNAGGIPRRISFADNIVLGGAIARGGSMGPGDAVDTHGAAEEIYIERNVITGSPGAGINFECRSGVIRDNKINRPGGHGISIHNESDFDGDIICSGNKILQGGDNGIYLTPATRGASSTYLSALVENNEIVRAVDYCIQVGFSASAVLRGLVLKGNTCRGNNANLSSIIIQNARQPVVVGNNIDGNGSGTGVLRLNDCIGFVIDGNNVSNLTGSSGPLIYITAATAGSSTQGLINSNRASVFLGSGLAGPGVQLDNNVQYTNVIGNNVRGTGGITLGTGTGNAQANNII